MIKVTQGNLAAFRFLYTSRKHIASGARLGMKMPTDRQIGVSETVNYVALVLLVVAYAGNGSDGVLLARVVVLFQVIHWMLNHLLIWKTVHARTSGPIAVVQLRGPIYMNYLMHIATFSVAAAVFNAHRSAVRAAVGVRGSWCDAVLVATTGEHYIGEKENASPDKIFIEVGVVFLSKRDF